MAIMRKPPEPTPLWVSVLIQLVGVAGFGLMIEGVRRLSVPSAMVVGGAMTLLWTILKVRRS